CVRNSRSVHRIKGLAQRQRRGQTQSMAPPHLYTGGRIVDRFWRSGVCTLSNSISPIFLSIRRGDVFESWRLPSQEEIHSAARSDCLSLGIATCREAIFAHH